MDTKLKFYQTLFETPMDGEMCLCCDKYGDFQILSYCDEECEFWDCYNDVFYEGIKIILWARLPKKECKEYINKITTGIKQNER